MKKPKELAKEIVVTIKNTHGFLKDLRHIGSFYYRSSKFRCSDVELEDWIRSKVDLLIVTVREEVIAREFLNSPEVAEKYKAFHDAVIAEAKELTSPGAL